MSTEPRVIPSNAKVWTNRHDTYTQSIDNLFDISNGNTGNNLNDYNATTIAIQDIIAKAITANKKIRALGGGWSFSKVAATDGWILNTKLLNLRFPIKDAANVSPQYKGQKETLLFAQCGCSVKELNEYLKDLNKSLKTSGASNGQTIVGATSTGTHGSAVDFGSTPDFIAGLHIIVSPQKHIWLERASHPVVSDLFIQRLKTELIRDDDLFNAALVGLGSFGFVHGAMIETEEIYLLECYRQRIPLDASLKHIMNTLDFSGANFTPHGNERPFHFQAVVNQYDLAGGAYVTLMYKRPYTTAYQPQVVDPNKAGPGDDVPAFLGKVTDHIPFVTHILVNQLIKTTYALFSDVKGTSGEIFNNFEIRGKVISTALGIPVDRVNEVNDLLIQLNNSHGPFSGIFSYRYVKKTTATLGFTRFDHTCILELDGIESSLTRNFYDVVWKELETRNIPYTFHWGKINNLSPQKMKNMYGADMDKWIAARNKLVPVESLKIFNTATLHDWGLDVILPPKQKAF